MPQEVHLAVETEDRTRPSVDARHRGLGNGRLDTVYESLGRLTSPNLFLWIEVVEQTDAPLGVRSR